MPKSRANGEGTLRKRPDGRWEVRYTDPREIDHRKRLKYITHKSQKVVLDKLRIVQAEIAGGEKPLISSNPDLGEWLERWLKEYKLQDIRDSTHESYERQIRTNIIPYIGRIKLKALTGEHIQSLFNQLQKSKAQGGRGVGSATVIKVKNILSGALDQAVISGMIRSNPVKSTSAPKVKESDIQVMSKAEQQQFIAVLPFFNTGIMFAVALATGCRIGELCALEVGDIDREQKSIEISKTAGRRKDKHTGEVAIKVGLPKTRSSRRRIPLLPSIEVLLDRQAMNVAEMRVRAGEMWTPNNLVFPTDMGTIHDLSGLRSSMSRILARAGLPHMSIHSLRHTFATTALNSGVAAQNVAKLLGHKDGATTLRFYAHYINNEALAQLDKLEKQNISHLGISAADLERIMLGTAQVLEKVGISQRIDDAVRRGKSFSPLKSVEMVLSVCEDILCQPADEMTADDRDLLLKTLGQYTVMKRQLEVRERQPQATRASRKKEKEVEL